jgi:hypothetical protein
MAERSVEEPAGWRLSMNAVAGAGFSRSVPPRSTDATNADQTSRHTWTIGYSEAATGAGRARERRSE